MPTDEERLVVALEARVRDFERNFLRASRVSGEQFTRIERRAKESGDRLERTMGAATARMSTAMKAGLAGLAAGGVIGVAGRLADVAKGIAEIGDEARRAGLDVKAFQELKFVAEQNRIDVDAMVDGIKELNLRADEWIVTGSGPAAEAFQRLGYSAADLERKLKDPSRLFTEIIGKLESFDQAARIRIADEIFGGTGGERFVQLIEQGERALRDQIDAANDLGIVLSDEVIARADEVDRRFRMIATTVSTNLKAAIVEATTALQRFIDSFRDFDNQQAATLGSQLATIGKQRLDLENRILKLRGEQRDAVPGNPFAPDYEEQIATLEAERAALGETEGQILRVIEARRKASEQTPAATPPAMPPAPPRTRTGGRTASTRSASADSAARERQAVADLIAELEEELRLVGASEQEQRAAAAARRAGSAATDEQRQRIIALNEAIYQECTALETQRERMQSMADVTREFISGFRQDLLSGVPPLEALGNAIGRLSDRIFDELLDALFTVKDVGAGGSGGGFFQWLLSFFGFATGGEVNAKQHAPKVKRLAGGGHVLGPGTSTSDSIPAMLSDGEFVVNAAATRRHRALLEAVNDNRLPGFASGGYVGEDAPSLPRMLRAGNDNIAPSVEINAPITVNGSAGTPEQNADLAKKMAKELENTMRGVVISEIRTQMRPGNLLNNRVTR
ncbi:tail tape measure protein [Aquibium sp. LZ166]|uniref:Tail tape measure protein n=1 Tax=Aquibium pacificus TaxID=3153579 RepID=A0ABV3SP47_9HYPH